mgnify:CR=1 FL=1
MKIINNAIICKHHIIQGMFVDYKSNFRLTNAKEVVLEYCITLQVPN